MPHYVMRYGADMYIHLPATKTEYNQAIQKTKQTNKKTKQTKTDGK